MRWLESIRLNTSPADADHLAGLLQETVQTLSEIKGMLDASVYVNAEYGGDLTVLLHWETEFHDPGGSSVGQRISHALRGQGIVSHSVWLVRKESD